MRRQSQFADQDDRKRQEENRNQNAESIDTRQRTKFRVVVIIVVTKYASFPVAQTCWSGSSALRRRCLVAQERSAPVSNSADRKACQMMVSATAMPTRNSCSQTGAITMGSDGASLEGMFDGGGLVVDGRDSMQAKSGLRDGTNATYSNRSPRLRQWSSRP